METIIKCAHCKKPVQVKPMRWFAFNMQRGKEQLFFCSASCLSSWLTMKVITLVLSLVIGVVLVAASLSEGFGSEVFLLLFGPYMIRQAFNRLGSLFDSGVIGEIITFSIILLGSITVVYPAYLIFQEIQEYLRIRAVLKRG